MLCIRGVVVKERNVFHTLVNYEQLLVYGGIIIYNLVI